MTGKVRQPRDNEKYWALLEVEKVNDMDPETSKERSNFDKLTPLFPDERFRLESGPTAVTERIIDMIAPIGKGQRGMGVAAEGGEDHRPQADRERDHQLEPGHARDRPTRGRTARGGHGLATDGRSRRGRVLDVRQAHGPAHPGHGARARAVAAPRRIGQGRRGSSSTRSPRLARAYNLAAPSSGKILSGGIDSGALYPPRRFFGAARNIEEGGSLTIIASALVETGSRMDDGIFEEFKGTGNMELRLDRSLSEKRLFPAINVDASGTRKEELLMPRRSWPW